MADDPQDSTAPHHHSSTNRTHRRYSASKPSARPLRLLRPGGLIAIDNALWFGTVAMSAWRRKYAFPFRPEDAARIHGLNAKLHADGRVDVCLLPSGDGVYLARKRAGWDLD